MNDLYAATEKTISMDCYPGYPTTRLVIENAHQLDDLTLPDGPWTTRVMTLPSTDKQQSLLNQGYELDSLGRPLHPWLRDMLSNPEVGIVTGTGEYWNWGPNHTADPIILSNDPIPKVLLIKRSDTGKWALPGGYVDGNENAVDAAKRELFEEAGIVICESKGVQIYNGVVADLRTTAHAWAETTATLWYVDKTPDVYGSDDAIDAKWFESDNLPAKLHGSHAVLIKKALESTEPSEPTHIISLPRAETYRQANGGHMTYRRIIVKHRDGNETFIKSHDKSAFTDPIREAHSRLYLHKELHLYNHLRDSHFIYIPDSVRLHDDNTLAMQALSESDGWQWRASHQHLDAYLTSIIDAIDVLNALPLPGDFKDAEVSVNKTLTEEGWDLFTHTSLVGVSEKLHSWQQRFRPEFQLITESFIGDVMRIKQEFTLAKPTENNYLCHHDMRQANIAWHPYHGVKLVDWSWAGIGSKNADTTMLLIDLHKAGHDVARYMNRFDPQHARTLIGFWLAHSLLPTQGDDSVRFHQLVSALSAYDLLTKDR